VHGRSGPGRAGPPRMGRQRVHAILRHGHLLLHAHATEIRSGKRYRTPFEGQRLDLLGARFQLLAIGAPGRDAVKPYPLVDDLAHPVLRVGMPRAPRLIAPEWSRSSQRAVGNPAFLERRLPRGGRRKSVFVPSQIQALGD